MNFFKLFVFLLLMAVIQSGKKPACECIKYLTESSGKAKAVVANLYIFKKGKENIVLKGNCSDVRRSYLFDENKHEYEKEEIVCISKGEIAVTVNSKTEISLYNSSKSAILEGHEARDYFFNDLLKQKNQLFTIVYSPNGNVAESIKSADYLEESYLKVKATQKLIKE